MRGEGTFSVVPPGVRSFYCLTVLSRASTSAVASPAGFDSCAGSSGVTLLAGRDSGAGTYQPYQLGAQTSLGIETPIYAGGTVPKTIAARRAAFVGWVGTLTNPGVLLDQSLRGDPGRVGIAEISRRVLGCVVCRRPRSFGGHVLTTA